MGQAKECGNGPEKSVPTETMENGGIWIRKIGFRRMGTRIKGTGKNDNGKMGSE